MKDIRLIRQVTAPDGRGPGNGMYALQRAIRAFGPSWLHIGGHLRNGEIPWIWLYKDMPLAEQFNEFGWPFVIGPNVLFRQSARPGSTASERLILDAPNCVLQFTESAWYASLIQRHCDRNEAPIVLWPYPIDPQPGPPLTAAYDFLVYIKDMSLGRELCRCVSQWPRSRIIVYGHYHRDDLIQLARRSRCCLYLSTDDRGPLAAAEIALSGCPLIGIERGCPWVLQDGLGVELRHFGRDELSRACDVAMSMSRDTVRQVALEFWSPQRIVGIITDALSSVASADDYDQCSPCVNVDAILPPRIIRPPDGQHHSPSDLQSLLSALQSEADRRNLPNAFRQAGYDVKELGE